MPPRWSLIIFVIASVTARAPWMEEVHSFCFKGTPDAAILRKGFRQRCESYAKSPAMHGKTKVPTFIISAVSNNIAKLRSLISFGPALSNGHPKWVNYTIPAFSKDMVAVSYPLNEFIYSETTDARSSYFIKIKTPDSQTAACYKLKDEKSPRLIFKRRKGCKSPKQEGAEQNGDKQNPKKCPANSTKH